MISDFPPIPVDFVVGHAQAKKTDRQRLPYVELVKAWAAHEELEEDVKPFLRLMSSEQQIDSEHMPKEFLPVYRLPDKAAELIGIVQEIDVVIASGQEMWTWAHVMRVMVDEGILLPSVTPNRFDAIICSMIPGKGRDTVRKHGNYALMNDRTSTYHQWSSISYLNPVEASNRAMCEQIAKRFIPVLGRKTINLS